MATPTFTPWRRYGHDRLYVNLDDRALGFRDMKTGTDHAEDGVDMTMLTALIEMHLPADQPASEPVPVTDLDSGLTDREAAAVVAGARTSETTEPAPVKRVRQPAAPVDPISDPEPAWTDLALNRPGQAARERATEEWETRKAEKPVRAFLGRVLDVHTDERSWRIGADGEEAVGSLLDKMCRKDSRWRVLHSVPVGERGSDIDHLVIGPGGVFTINAKHHPKAKVWVGKDSLRVNGHTQPYIRNSRFEAKRATRLLTETCGFDVRVDALIVMFGVEDMTIKTEPGERDGSTVYVKYRRQSIRWLTKQPTVLIDSHIEAIYEQARRSTTWST